MIHSNKSSHYYLFLLGILLSITLFYQTVLSQAQAQDQSIIDSSTGGDAGSDADYYSSSSIGGLGDFDDDDPIGPAPVLTTDRLLIPVNDDQIVSRLNSLLNTSSAGWTAGINDRWDSSTTIGDARSLCGLVRNPRSNLPLQSALHPNNNNPNQQSEGLLRAEEPLPESFDSRDKWGSICPSLYDVRDQGACGSCFSIAAAAAITDRICIASNGTQQPIISAGDGLSCCRYCGQGCRGGDPQAVWNYWVRSGIVTGGDYGTTGTCYPYPVPSCGSGGGSGNSGAVTCSSGRSVGTPRCPGRCINSGPTFNWFSQKYYGLSAYRVDNNQLAIQREIYTNGPVEVGYWVYEDFTRYKSGIYSYKYGSFLGGHAVKIIGWGIESGIPYWTAVNSWNRSFGENGLFRIRRGKNECGIEDLVVAGIPRI